MAKPERWNDEGGSARVVKVAPNDMQANQMRAFVLGGRCGAWEPGASLGGGAHGGGHARRPGCGAVQCSGGKSPVRQWRREVSPPGRRHVSVKFEGGVT